MKIDRFTGEYAFLSNFYSSPILHFGLRCKTVEHAYQASKTNDFAQREKIIACTTPSLAKRDGRRLTIRPDWDSIKVDVMEELLRKKFAAHPALATKLKATGDAQLEEGNYWGDRFWGVYHGQGQNNLGKLLMLIRSQI